jgi:hypothetical protein
MQLAHGAPNAWNKFSGLGFNEKTEMCCCDQPG